MGTKADGSDLGEAGIGFEVIWFISVFRLSTPFLTRFCSEMSDSRRLLFATLAFVGRSLL